MLLAAAVCPQPPLLVPGVAAGAERELDELRAAAGDAVRTVLAADVDLMVVVGAADAVGPAAADARGSLAGYGVPVVVGPGAALPSLSLALTVGRWLLDQQDVAAPLLFGVTPDSPPERNAGLGAALAERAPRVGLLAMGDGTTRRTPKGPGYFDERAVRYDAAVAAALAAGEPGALLTLDPAADADLGVGGRAAWQVLAGAAAVRPPAAWRAEVTYDAAPYGVGYLVATWQRADEPARPAGSAH